jgi:aspartyl/asparaginyl beta-hydroxylase (cupin superfamily)
MRVKNEMKNSSAPWLLNAVRMCIEFFFRFIDGDKTFYSTENLDWIKDFENNFPLIKKEYNQLIQKNVFIPNWQSISDDPNVRIGDDWKTFILKGYNKFVIRNCELCPETYMLIKKYPFIYTTWFSILEAGKKIPEHRGPYNGILRYHLALKVPADAQNCYIKVGNDVAYWQEGKSLLFDDTHLHAVWNNTSETRVILFVDVERPLLFPFNYLNRFIINQIGRSKFVAEVFDKLNT